NGTGDQWFTITLILSNKSLLQGINVLREHGATDVVVAPVRYLFLDRSPTFKRLCLALGGEQA
ncbi:MAG: hypothetical protein KC547_23070, partial [Anaerolineae bacterium]|nr:hypothetical protein [Anaerolineae bacterium]